MTAVEAPRDWLRAIVWVCLIAYILASLIAVLYFATRAIAGDPKPGKVVCTEPKTSGGPDWGISTITCEAR